MKKIIFFLLFINKLSSVSAQFSTFPENGLIIYEKKVNLYAILQKKANANDKLSEAFDEFKRTKTQFLIEKGTLQFSPRATLYTPISSRLDPSISYFGEDPITNQLSKVYTILTGENERIVQKTIQGQPYLLKDTLPSIKWKITEETRDIAGYTCRRANGLLQDSIYVVAFYTNEIHISSGPESFHGLPGMILGLAMPYQHVSWFALEVDITKNEVLKAPDTGKATNKTELHKILKDMLPALGSHASQWLDYYLL